jgi:hypothetical protein
VASCSPAAERAAGLRASIKMPVKNGPIDCRWLRYDIGEA